MKTRKLDLTEISYDAISPSETSTPVKNKLSIRRNITVILCAPAGDRTFSADQVLKAAELAKKINNEPGQHIYLETSEYSYLLEKLNSFPFSNADQGVAEFITRIRSTPEVEIVPSENKE